MPHKSVLLKEVLAGLDLKPGMVVADGTFGAGGHSRAILDAIGITGKLIALDQDPESLARGKEAFKHDTRVHFEHENFVNLDRVLERLNIPEVDAVLLDVGFSSDQLENAERGFSFERTGPLDMRMNPENTIQAKDLVNDLPEHELEQIFRDYGQERWARRFASTIARHRAKHRIETTGELVDVIDQALPYSLRSTAKSRRPGARIHPATRVFQALRIAVNGELDVLREGLPRIWKHVRPGGRLGVISFHSLEDRIVKQQFREWKQNKEASEISKKPVTASREEEIENPRSRSAKFRVAVKR